MVRWEFKDGGCHAYKCWKIVNECTTVYAYGNCYGTLDELSYEH